MIFISAIPKPSAAPKATEIKSSANNEGESLIEYMHSDDSKIDITGERSSDNFHAKANSLSSNFIPKS